MKPLYQELPFAVDNYINFYREDLPLSLIHIFNHASKRCSATSSVKAPFFTPPNKCFFINTPSLERILRTVSVG